MIEVVREWSRGPMVGTDCRSVSNRSDGAGQLDGAIVPHRHRRRRGDGAAVRVGRVRLAAVGAAVLSRAAADPDRGARLEPLGGADRGDRRRGRALPPCSARSSSSPSCSASACRPGGSAISRCWRGRPTSARRGSNGIRSAIWCSGPRSSARSIVIAAMLNFGTDEETFRASLRSGLERMLRFRGSAVGRSPGRARPRPAGRHSWWRCCRRRPRCSPPSPTSSTSGSPRAIVKVSGRLRRPWPDLAAMRFPSYAPVLHRRCGRGLVPARAHRHRRRRARRRAC